MLELIKRTLRASTKHAHLLGGLYYAYALLTALVSAAYAIYKQLSTPSIAGPSEWFFWAFVVFLALFVLLIPIIVSALIKSSRPTSANVANPTLIIQKRTVHYTVTRSSIVKRQTLELEATAETACFRLYLTVSGTASSRITNVSSGTSLLGPVSRGGADSYELQFDAPLKSGQLFTLAFDIEVDNSAGTMRPYLSDTFHNCLHYGAFAVTYCFPISPANLTLEKQNIAGETLERTSPHPKTLHSGVEYKFSVNQVDEKCVYTLTWMW